MQPTLVILRLLVTLAAGAVAAAAFAATASAELKQGDILVVDPDVPPVSTALLFQVDPLTGARVVIANFGASSPSAVAVGADGAILVTDTAAGTDPSGGTNEWGALYRLSPDPVSGELIRMVLTDFGVGPSTGRNPRAVTVEPDGQILVINGNGGTADRAVLVRIDPNTGARSVVSDFGNGGQGGLGVEPRGVAVEADGRILVIDAQAGMGGQGELVRVNPQTGVRTSVHNFGAAPASPGSNPIAVAVEANGQILVADEGHGSTTPLGLLFRLDPGSGLRTTLSDFNTGANTGREPEGVALEADGQILVVDKHAGVFTRGMLFRVNPQTGDRAILSDFGAGANQGGDPLALAVVPPTHGTIVVVNEVVNDNGGTAVASDWTMTVLGGNPVPASFPGAGLPGTTVTLEPAFYSVVPARGLTGYANSFSAGCGGAIGAGETRTCTITHDDQPGSLRVVNEVVNDNGGTAVASDWTTTVTGANPVPASFPGAGAPGTTVTLDAGAYSVSANGPAGYSSTLSTDCGGTISTGETKTCTITNDDQPGTLMVVVEVVNDHGGNAVPGDFFITVGGGNPSPASFPGQGPPGTTVTLDAGNYSVPITLRPHYVVKSFSPGCAGTIAAGEAKTCTITTDDLPAILFVIHEVVNDNGGSAVAGDFTVSVTGGDPSPASFPGQGDPGTTVLLDAGSYSLSVTGPAGYTSSLSPDCAGTIGIDERRTCTITHDDRPAMLIVVVEIVNDNGGSTVASDVPVRVHGNNPSPAGYFPGQGPPGTTVTLDAGSHGLEYDTGALGRYAAVAPDPDCVGTIAAGETKTCTLSFDDLPGTLVVVTEVVNDDGGTAVAGDFTVTVTGGDPSPASFAGQGVPGVTVTLDAGSYSVSVTGPPGYTSTFSPDCAAPIGLAETKTCTITSNDPPPAVPTCDGKVATIVGTPGPTELLGTSGDDVVVDVDGDNVVRGRGGNDTVCTGLGNDRIFLGGGADTVLDTGGRNTVEGGAGSDSITTGAGDDHIDGGGGNDTVVAGGGANVVDGQAGNDTIRTGAGDDRIDGGPGFDTCRPGTGANIVRRCEVIV